MNMQLLKRLYNIYSPSGKEEKMVKFLCSYIRQLPGNISMSKDKFGNLYVVKGESESYPCLVSHIDQVSHCNHSKDFKAIETRDIIFGYSPKNRRFENLGADDKNGVFICLECLKKHDAIKVVFFREEEVGCRGSSEAMMSFFDDIRFVIQPDRKGNSDLITNISYSELCSEKFLEEVEPEKWGYREENGLMTDVLTLKENGLGVSCINVSCGYYNPHTDEEVTVKKDLMKSLSFIEHIIEDCTDVYPHILDYGYWGRYDYELEDEIYEMLNSDPTLTPKGLYDMYSTTYPYLGLEDYERIYKDFRMFGGDEESINEKMNDYEERRGL
ncbi:hypothetical protein [Bacteroides sp. AF25-38AC]|uniref:hypothetical protein n=1 Tax=unclassified Bacteroides TaxID=2646097 RepID=UPI000E73A024|nr:hypothetical protein [Bacteroides sp. AF25-38AC]RJV34123.1 hypothetical protein DWY55_17505 [Bacteroides sp. AF25-38AC]